MNTMFQSTVFRLAMIALALGGCATITTTTRSAREVQTREAFERRARGPLRGEVSVDGVLARVQVSRTDVCERGTEARGVEVVTTVRQADGGSWLSMLSLGGAGAAVIGALLIVAPTVVLCTERSPCTHDASGMTVSAGGVSTTDVQIAGAITTGVGLLMLVPWMHAVASSGTSQTSRAFAENEGVRRDECTPVVASREQVALRARGRSFEVRRTGEDGVVEFDLPGVLPREALRGADPWTMVEVVSGESVLGSVPLESVRQLVADRAWEEATGREDVAALERFAADFPDDSRSAEVAERVANVRRETALAARDRERRAQWSAAGSDANALRELAEEGVRDAYEADARCALAERDAEADGSVAGLHAALGGCRGALASVPAVLQRSAPDVMTRAIQRRDGLVRRVEEAEMDARAQAEREAAARVAAAERERVRREAEAARARAQREAAARAGVARGEASAAACRGGAAGPATARAGYSALGAARGVVEPAVIQRVVMQIAGACRCTPTCAGVAGP